MITSVESYQKFGDPFQKNPKYMTAWDVPSDLEIGFIPKKIYCNSAMILPLICVFTALIKTDTVKELKTFDGCYNPRVIRGYESKYANLILNDQHEEAMKYVSLHSFGIACDFNAFENQLKTKGNWSAEFVKCFTDNGFDWGGNFQRKDPMHFQLSKI